MRENIKARPDSFPDVKELFITTAKHLFFAVVGFFCSRVTLVGGMSPLGIVLAAGVPYRYMFAASVGAFGSYFFGTILGGQFKYLAALVATLLIRFIVKDLKASKKAYPMMFISFATVLTTGLVTAENDFAGLVSVISESVITAAFSFFIFTFFSLLESRTAQKSNELLVSFLFTLNIMLLGLYPVSISLISVGRVLAMTGILYAARFGKVGYGTVCAVVVGISMRLGGQTATSFCVAVSGLAAALTSAAGNVFSALFFVGFTALGGAISGYADEFLILLTESVIASIIFLAIPRNVASKISVVFSPPAKLPELDGLRRSIVMRLGFASASLLGVAKTVEDVGKKLTQKNSMDFEKVIELVESDACRGCNLAAYCWEKSRSDTVAALISMSEAIKHGRAITFDDMPIGFNEHCIRRDRVETALSVNYKQFLNRRAAEIRVEEMRQIVADQFSGISDMLRDLEEEINTSQTYDIKKAGDIAEALSKLGINAEYCGCITDKYGRITVEIKLPEPPQMPINRARIMELVASVCGREMEPPAVNRVGNAFFVTVTEKARLAVDCGIAHINYKDNLVCGDTAESFYDGRGHFVTILSDGMGTGGRAAVDSAMASALMSRLLRSGFGYDCSLKIVNSAMMFRSTDESLATLDIASLDLFSGECDLLKAGAGPTFARRNGKIGIARCHCLPVGILRDISFDRAEIKLVPGDVFLIMSDGVITENEDWLINEMLAFDGTSAQHFAEHIADHARRHRTDGHEDDITVVAVSVSRAM